MLLDWILFLTVLGGAGFALWAAVSGQRRRAAQGLGVAGAGLILGLLLVREDLAMQKLVSWLAMPMGLLWLLTMALPIMAYAKGQRAVAAFSAGLFVAYTLLGNVWFSSWLANGLEEGIPTAASALAGEPFDAVLVVGGGAVWRQGEPELTDYGDRVLVGARLFRGGKAKVLVTTGSSIAGLGEVQDLTTATAQLWKEMGVEEAAIIRIPEPKNTSQEIAAFKQRAAREGWRRVAVVSSAWHLPRIRALAKAEGIEVALIGADHRGGQQPLHPAYAVPAGVYFRTSQLMAWESLGRAVGR